MERLPGPRCAAETAQGGHDCPDIGDPVSVRAEGYNDPGVPHRGRRVAPRGWKYVLPGGDQPFPFPEAERAGAHTERGEHIVSGTVEIGMERGGTGDPPSAGRQRMPRIVTRAAAGPAATTRLRYARNGTTWAPVNSRYPLPRRTAVGMTPNRSGSRICCGEYPETAASRPALHRSEASATARIRSFEPRTRTMAVEQILAEVRTFTGLLEPAPPPGSEHPELSWDDHFFYYAPNDLVPGGRQPNATVITKNHPGDTESRLGHGGRQRLNIRVGTEAFTDLIGLPPETANRPGTDYSIEDSLLPHPCTGCTGGYASSTPLRRPPSVRSKPSAPLARPTGDGWNADATAAIPCRTGDRRRCADGDGKTAFMKSPPRGP